MSPTALEANVRRLLRRSYVPALPAPEFRDRLEELVVTELRRRARGRRRAPPGAPAWRWLAAAAAVLLALIAAWRLLGRTELPPRERLLARGEAALGLPDGSWRAPRDEERAHGVHVAQLPLVIVTPEELALDLLVEQARIRLEPCSELRLARADPGPTATLVAGAAELTRGGERLALAVGRTTVLSVQASAPEVTLAQEPPAAREARPPVSAPAGSATETARLFEGRASAEGLPVTGFSVALLGERDPYQTHPPLVRDFTSSDGFFAWPDPPRGKQRVFVHAPGFALCALGEHDFSGAPPELSAELVAGVTLRGSVLDAAGNPVAGALVIAEDEAPTDGLLFLHSEHTFWLPVRAETGPDGRFELAHLAPGSKSLRIEAEGCATTWVDGLTVDGSPREELVVRLGRGGAIEGRVEEDDGSPWVDAEVVVVAMDQHLRERQSVGLARTDAEGRFRFEHLPPLPMLVVLLRSELRPDVRPVQVETDKLARCDFPAPLQGIRVHGHLRDADGQPVGLRSLGLFDRETASWNQDWVASTTAPDGSYAFEGVRPGAYALYLVDQLGRGLRCLGEIDVGPGSGDVEHELVVPSGSLAVHARAAADGAPVAQAFLMLMRLEDDGRRTFAAYELLDDGRALLTQLAPGRYSIAIYPMVPGLAHAQSEPVHVGAEAAPPLELVLEPGCTAEVVVRAPDGRPLEGATVVFRDARGQEHQFSRVPATDAEGRYVAHGLRPERYRVVVALSGHATATVAHDFRLGHAPEIPVLLTPLPPR